MKLLIWKGGIHKIVEVDDKGKIQLPNPTKLGQERMEREAFWNGLRMRNYPAYIWIRFGNGKDTTRNC